MDQYFEDVQQRKEYEASKFAQDAALRGELIKRQRLRIRRIRQVVGYDNLDKDSLFEECETALTFGYYRALLKRFMADHGITHEWLVAQRREFKRAISGNDRTWDLVIVNSAFPEFVDYYPETPITGNEVVDASEDEFWDLMCSYGSDYAEDRGVAFANQPVDKWRSQMKHWFGEDYEPKAPEPYMDLSAEQQIVHIAQEADLSDDDVLGPAITRLTEKAIEFFGPRVGIYYIMEKLFFPGKHTALLRAMAGEEAANLSDKEFEAIKRDIQRKMAPHAMTLVDEFHTLIREDEELRELFEKLQLGKRYDPTK